MDTYRFRVWVGLMNREEVWQALASLIEDGAVIDSGRKRPDSKGVMQTVWIVNPDYDRSRLDDIEEPS